MLYRGFTMFCDQGEAHIENWFAGRMVENWKCSNRISFDLYKEGILQYEA
jgi:hypothetical protein